LLKIVKNYGRVAIEGRGGVELVEEEGMGGIGQEVGRRRWE
jgi:hypothetical protein